MSKSKKYLFSLILVFSLIAISIAQGSIPNAGFENWSGGEPDSWVTPNIAGIYVPVTQSQISHTGIYAVKGEVLNTGFAPFPPGVVSDTTGFSISQNYTRMTGYYQFTNMGEDVLYMAVVFLDAQEATVANGGVELGETSTGYARFIVNMDYSSGSGEAPVEVYIIFGITVATGATADTITVGSNFLVDDLDFDMVAGIDNKHSALPITFALEQNFPNPFNPSTTIEFSIPQVSAVRLIVFNSLGQEVETLINREMSAGMHQVSFDASQLPSGVYFYKIEAGGFLASKKMILIK